MIRTNNRFLKSLATTLSTVLPAFVLAGCSAATDEMPTPADEDVSESAATLGVEVPTCSQPASSLYNKTTGALTVNMTGSTPTVVFGVVSGYITVNGYKCVMKTADGGGKITPALVKKVTITGTSANNEKIVIDTLTGALGATILATTGGITVDLVSGTGDSFSLRGSNNADKWTAGDSGGATYFELSGDTNADLKVANADVVAISTSAGADTFSGRGGAFVASHLNATPITTLSAVAGDITVNGGDGDDTINGGNGDDVLSGSAGNDTFKVAAGADGADTINGGAGVDKMDYTGRTGALTVVMDGATASGLTGGTEGDLVGADVEDLVGGTVADTLTGNTLANHIYGGAGNDVLSGGPAGTCTADIDVLDGEGDDDRFDMGAINDCGDTLNGGAGIDRADYQARTAAMTITIDGTANDGLSAGAEKDNVKSDVEILVSGSGVDTITGSALADEIHGGPGGDTINAGGGNDVLVGNSGNDTINGEGGDDTFKESDVDAEYTVAENEGDGNDILNGGSNSGSGVDLVTYAARTANLTVTICTDATKLTGNSTATGQCADNDGDTGAGEADKIVNVTHLIGGEGDDVLRGHTADDTIEGGDGDDDLHGGAGSDALFGDADDDDLFGDAGDDHLDGGGDTDTFEGGAGANASDGDICIIETGETNANCDL